MSLLDDADGPALAPPRAPADPEAGCLRRNGASILPPHARRHVPLLEQRTSDVTRWP
jgi:hypothetical protein